VTLGPTNQQSLRGNVHGLLSTHSSVLGECTGEVGMRVHTMAGPRSALQEATRSFEAPAWTRHTGRRRSQAVVAAFYGALLASLYDSDSWWTGPRAEALHDATRDREPRERFSSRSPISTPDRRERRHIEHRSKR